MSAKKPERMLEVPTHVLAIRTSMCVDSKNNAQRLLDHMVHMSDGVDTGLTLLTATPDMREAFAKSQTPCVVIISTGDLKTISFVARGVNDVGMRMPDWGNVPFVVRIGKTLREEDLNRLAHQVLANFRPDHVAMCLEEDQLPWGEDLGEAMAKREHRLREHAEKKASAEAQSAHTRSLQEDAARVRAIPPVPPGNSERTLRGIGSKRSR